MVKKIENRGGKRAGSGRKKISRNHSEKTIKRYEMAARKLAKEFGMPLEEALLRMVYSPDIQDTVKCGIMKQYNEVMVIKKTESESTVKQITAPSVYLPERRPDPALEVVKGGKG